MLEIWELTNEELITRYKNNNEEALNVLWKQNEKLTYKMINKFVKSSDLDKDDMLSICHVAFMYTVRSFKVEKNTKFTTMYVMNIKHMFYNEQEKKKMQKRANYTTVSIDKPITKEDDCTLLDLIADESPDLGLAEWDHVLLQKAIEYACSRIKPEYHKHAIDYYFNEQNKVSAEHIAQLIEEEAGIKKTKQVVSKTLMDFRNHIRDYIVYDSNKKIIQMNKLSKNKEELLLV